MAPTAKKPQTPLETAEQDHIPEFQPINSASIVIIQPGSLNLRIGRASDALPQCHPHCIAYRRKPKTGDSNGQSDLWFERRELTGDESLVQDGLRQAEDVLLSRPFSSGEYRQSANSEEILQFNSQVQLDVSSVTHPTDWTDTSDNKPYYTGNQALSIKAESDFSLVWPMRGGFLNLHGNPGGTLRTVLEAIEAIWRDILEREFNISKECIKNYYALLILPDLTERHHIKEFTNLLLNALGFGYAMVQQESVASLFGAGISSACVVDVGDQKTSVTCVEEGISLPSTRISMSYGGSDITRCFYWLLCNNGFPYKECDLSKCRDAFMLQEFKESHCTLNQDESGITEKILQHKTPMQPIVNYKIQLGDERLLAPLALFFPSMFGLKSQHLTRVYKPIAASDPEDPFDDDYIQQTQSKQEQSAKLVAARKKGGATDKSQDASQVEMDVTNPEVVAMDDSQSAAASPAPPDAEGSRTKRATESAAKPSLPERLLGVTEAVLHSIDKCDGDDVKKKMYSCILVTGGGLMFEGAHTWIQNSVWLMMPSQFRNVLETMDVITKAKDLDPTVVSWKGASIMTIMESSRELWVSQNDWKKVGLRALREKMAFLW